MLNLCFDCLNALPTSNKLMGTIYANIPPLKKRDSVGSVFSSILIANGYVCVGFETFVTGDLYTCLVLNLLDLRCSHENACLLDWLLNY